MNHVLATFDLYLREFWLPGNANDPYDRIVIAYPPLRDYVCYALQFNQNGVRFASCAESVLSLALYRVWLDENEKKPRRERTDISLLETLAPNGLTILQMIRRLQRMRLSKFPVYEYQPALDTFVLLNGAPRKDNQAIVYLPADPHNGLPQNHWTYTTVVFEKEPVLPGIKPEAVIYSRLPVIENDGSIYWRTALCPENREEYETLRAIGCACDCDWRFVCSHEAAFLAAHPAALRISLAGRAHVHGTLRAQVVGSLGVRKVILGARGRVTVSNPHGYLLSEEACANRPNVRVRGLWRFMRLLRNNDIADYSKLATIDIAPYRLDVFEFTDERQLQDYRWLAAGAVSCLAIMSLWALFRKPREKQLSISERSIHHDFFRGPPSGFSRALIESRERPMFSVVGRAGLGTAGLLGFGLGCLFGYRYARRIYKLDVIEPEMAWAADQDLTLRLPRRDELLARLATRKEITEDSVIDTVRRIAQEESWQVDITRAEFRDWLHRVVTEVGTMSTPAVEVGQCWNCLQYVPTYRHCCKACKRKTRQAPPEALTFTDALVTHVGFRPLWSRDFRIPKVALKSDVYIYDSTAKTWLIQAGTGMSFEALVSRFKKHEGALSVRGKLCGPMFLGQEPSCFPRGEGVAMQAFLVRLGAKRAAQAQASTYRICYDFIEPFLDEIEAESWELFISHFVGEKRRKMEEARLEDREGWAPRQNVDGELRIKMMGFAKSERSTDAELVGDLRLYKEETKPRLICSPNPLMLYRLGRWTHAQTKWLAKRFGPKDHMFYAGCASPRALNEWLNWTISECPESYTLVDDISAMDSNHSIESFRYHKRIRTKQFPHIDAWTSAAYDAEEQLVIRIGRFKVSVGYVNASGVSDTSYKNSMICLVVRVFAVLHAFVDTTELDSEEVVYLMREILPYIWTSASGDDGLTRMGERVYRWTIQDFNIQRYREAWALAGFGVKASLVPPNRWRMATYLAMRPVWSGDQYEWAPEPARRLRTMFWQFECGLHHMSWARGVATQMLVAARHAPILNQISTWFLERTKGPIAKVDLINPYSAFAGLKSSGSYNARAEAEFCLDYRVTVEDIRLFERVLAASGSVLVNIDTQVIRRIYAEES